MNNDHVFPKLHARAILLVVHQKDFLGGLGQLVAGAVQRVVECLRDLEEVVAAGDDVPVGGYAQLGAGGVRRLAGSCFPFPREGEIRCAFAGERFAEVVASGRVSGLEGELAGAAG